MRMQLFAAAAAAAVLGAAPSAMQASPSGLDAILDPTRALLSLCGQTPIRAATLRTQLQLAAAADAGVDAVAQRIALIEGMGELRFPITTGSSQAQRYFDQGLMFTYGFNHEAAIRSFRAAQGLDPNCAMCFWGEAYAHGPNINAPMDAEAGAAAVKAARRAAELARDAAPEEQALIQALQLRYSDRPDADRAALDRAYAAAMKQAAARFPNNDDVAVLAAEAAMDLQPWDYWQADRRTPKGDIGWAIGTVEKVLKRNPDHAQGAHLYIHLMEASAMPEKAEPYADRLAKPLAPSAGHLVHMPAHLYYRLGRFRDSIRANVAAAKADEAYLAANPGSAIYRYGYYPHNVHFILTSAQMAGDRQTVLDQSARLRRVVDADTASKLAWVQSIVAAPYFAHAQFAEPAEILAQPAPDARLPYVTGMWRYSRAIGYAMQRDDAGVERELAELRRIRTDTDFSAMTAAGVPAPMLLELAEEVARGRLAGYRGDHAGAVRHYRAAVALEDQVPYMEPPFWYFPVRQSLGAALLQGGDAAAAKQTFMEALARAPNNAWALYGLAEAQGRLGDRRGERATRAALQRAWLGERAWLKLERL
jgi:tetratricopeptide (TPR) repeat protein